MEVNNMPKIDIMFSKASDYKVIPATGAWGGLSPNGEVIVDFFIERRQDPSSIIITVDEQKRKVEEQQEPTPTVFVRELQFGVVMRPDIAYSIGKFLMEKAALAGYREKDEFTQH